MDLVLSFDCFRFAMMVSFGKEQDMQVKRIVYKGMV